MSDGVPTQFWLFIGIVAAGYRPARYVAEYCIHSPSYRDITQPQEDLAWRTPGKLALNLAVVVGLVAFAVFIFTPPAQRLARAAFFLPLLFGATGAGALFTVVRGLLDGRISPWVRGAYNTFERATQPKRFWASLAWNGVVGALLLGIVPLTYQDQLKARCHNYRDTFSHEEQLVACNEVLDGDPKGTDRVDLLRARGIAYHNLGRYDLAARDYSRAIELDPKDSYSLYNRGLVRQELGDFPGAVRDFDESIRLRPNNEEAYFNRGLIYMDVGAFDHAVVDLTRAHELDLEDDRNLANRGLAYAWQNEREKARADFAKVSVRDPTNQVVARGRAVLAMRSGDPEGAVALLTKALENDPQDVWSLKKRADIYWDMELQDLARDDDDRRAEIERQMAAARR